MRSRWLPHPLLTPILTVIWLLLVNSIAPGQILLGLLLGWGLPLFTLRFWPETVPIYRPLVLVRFIAIMLYDIAVANLTVAWLVLGSTRKLRPAFVQVPLALKSDLAISLLSNTVCLTPGTVSSCVSRDRQQLLVHALDCAEPERLIHIIKSRYEAPLREIFEKC